MTFEIDADEVLADLDELAAASGGRFAGAKRLAWSPDWLRAREWLRGKLAAASLIAEEDSAGNLWAVRSGHDGADDPFVVVGSHIDAVPDGGWLDGALGVLAALGALRAHAAVDERRPNRTAIGLRLVDWADEEGARFGRSLLGSSACAGTLSTGDVRDLIDPEGMRLEEALRECGVVLDRALDASERLRGAVAYLELHIEQGPALLEAARLVGAVSGTYGVERHAVRFRGETAHAGATPMSLRHDALAAAAEAILDIREIGILHGGVCTVGQIAAAPGVVTAIAGEVEIGIDQRHLDAAALGTMLAEAESSCARAAERHGCEVATHRLLSSAPTPFDPELVAIAGAAVVAAGGGVAEPLPSGPLHDATEIGRLVPTAMIFAQSNPPISHSRFEDSSDTALRAAIDAYGRTVGAVLERTADRLAVN